MGMKPLNPGSAEAVKRDELLAIMRDETKSDDERLQAAIAAAPLCHEVVKPVIVGSVSGPKRPVRRLK
jgi:hypothetical protein